MRNLHRSLIVCILLAVLSLSAIIAGIQFFYLLTTSADSTFPIQHIVVIFKENHTFDNYFGTYPGLPPSLSLDLTKGIPTNPKIPLFLIAFNENSNSYVQLWNGYAAPDGQENGSFVADSRIYGSNEIYVEEILTSGAQIATSRLNLLVQNGSSFGSPVSVVGPHALWLNVSSADVGSSVQFMTSGWVSMSSVEYPFFQTNMTPPDMDHDWGTAHSEWDNGSMDSFILANGTNETISYYNGTNIPYYWDYASQYVLADNYFSSVMGPSDPNHSFIYFGTDFNQTFNNVTFFGQAISNLYGMPSIASELGAAGLTFENYDQSFSGGIYTDIANHHLANVSYVFPEDSNSTNVSEHPPGNITLGMNWTVSIVNAIMNSSYWKSSAILITWDDYGGWYDNVAPPQVDSQGYGFRVPLLIISPYAKHGFIDNNTSDHTSILKFSQTVFGLPDNLSQRDENANNLLEAFNFIQGPRPPLILPGNCIPNKYPLVPSGCYNAPASIRFPSLSSTIVYWISAIIGVAAVVTFLGFRSRIAKTRN